MANQDEMSHIRSGGRRIELYAELGGYFSPDGHLDEPKFRSFVSASLKERATDRGHDALSPDQASEWLSSYLESVLSYLDQRGLHRATFRLFEVAVEEAAKLGIDKVALDPGRMKNLLSLASAPEESRPKSPADPDDKKRKIFDAALIVFAERGFHAATMDEIAATSGVGKGTLYRHFKSKEDLLDRLLAETSSEIIGKLSTIFSGRTDVLAEIHDFIEQWVEFIEKNHVLYRLIQTEGIIVPRSGKRTMFYEYLIANLPMLKEHFASMNRQRTLKLTSFHTVAYGMLGFIDGVVHRWFRSGMDYPLRDEIPIIAEVLFNGFVGERGDRKVFFVAPEDQE
jgi:TetR/AcrR family fatty acid metabolism transcriptional regulator